MNKKLPTNKKAFSAQIIKNNKMISKSVVEKSRELENKLQELGGNSAKPEYNLEHPLGGTLRHIHPTPKK